MNIHEYPQSKELMMDLKFLNTKEASQLLRIHPETLRRFIREGKIRAYRIGKQKLIKEDELKNFVEKSTRMNTH